MTMSDSLGDILARRDLDEPAEVRLIKDYVRQHFKSEVGVTLGPRQIIISAPNAALAGTLRLHSRRMVEVCQTDKRLVIRIGM